MKDRNKLMRHFYALLKETGLENNKADMVEAYGVESTKELSVEQLDELVQRLTDIKHEQTDKKIRKLRSQVLDLLTKLGIYKDTSSWTRVNKYLMNPRIAGKLMYEMNEEELQKLIKKLRVIHIKQEEKIQQDKFWASNN